jgi:hypothetical protein
MREKLPRPGTGPDVDGAVAPSRARRSRPGARASTMQRPPVDPAGDARIGASAMKKSALLLVPFTLFAFGCQNRNDDDDIGQDRARAAETFSPAGTSSGAGGAYGSGGAVGSGGNYGTNNGTSIGAGGSIDDGAMDASGSNIGTTGGTVGDDMGGDDLGGGDLGGDQMGAGGTTDDVGGAQGSTTP